MASKAQAAARAKFAKQARSKHKGSAVGRAAASSAKARKKTTAKKSTAKGVKKHPKTGRFLSKKR